MRKSKKEIIKNIFVYFVAAFAVFMMLYTVITVTTVDQKNRSIFGYKLMIVLSDSMSATDFNAGDIILVKETDPASLKPGDIIAYTSKAPENYGDTVAHKIRSGAVDAEGKPGFITYGTTTGVDDELVVSYSQVLGKYQMRIPAAGRFFSFIKSVPGYLLCILLPFLVLIVIQVSNSIKAFKEYKEEEMTGIAAERERLKAAHAEELSDIAEERERLKAEREETMRKLAELDVLKSKLAEAGIAYAAVDGTEPDSGNEVSTEPDSGNTDSIQYDFESADSTEEDSGSIETDHGMQN